MIRVWMVSRRATRCGVADYGQRIYAILRQSKLLDIALVEVSNAGEFLDRWRRETPAVILYNYHPFVLPWVTDEFLAPLRQVPQVAIYHEGGLAFRPDAIINIDSTAREDAGQLHFVSPRPLFERWELGPPPANRLPTIGSFGFGFPDKNFPLIAYLVATQFPQARLRLNIPFAEFGDDQGLSARREVEKVREVLRVLNPRVELEVSHDFIEQAEMLRWLHTNDLNLFLYDKQEARSLSSTIDYALSVRRPIGISSSVMFRHVAHVQPTILVHQASLPTLIGQGIQPLLPLYEEHSHARLIAKYEQAIATILRQRRP
jgi:hypothetical protein